MKEVHGLASTKTTAETDRKRAWQDEIEALRDSSMFARDPVRLPRLLKTRKIIYNNLPFKIEEYNETRIIESLFVKEPHQAPMSTKNITQSVVKMYVAAKKEVVRHFKLAQQGGHPVFTLVVDFWSCSPQNAKYLGARLYFVDAEWKFQSVLIGTRRFDPNFAERSKGIREPFRRWLNQMLDDFDRSDLFASMTDAGSDVK